MFSNCFYTKTLPLFKLECFSRDYANGPERYKSFVIAAEDEIDARCIACSEDFKNKTAFQIWLEQSESSCVKISEESEYTKPTIVCQGFIKN